MSNVSIAKGLDAILKVDKDSHYTESNNSTVLENSIHLLISQIQPNLQQPRKSFNKDTIQNLCDSIKQNGVLQPILVRVISNGKYEVIAGERRWRAAQLAGLTHIPAIVHDIEDNVALAFALIENIQRENLNPIEEAIAFSRFKDEFGMTHEEIASRVGRSRASITNTLRLLSLNDSVRKLVEDGQLDMGHARALLVLDANQQILAAEKIVNQQMSVREAEQLANAMKSTLPPKAATQSRVDINKQTYWTQALSNKFSANVSVKLNQRGGGKVIIQIDSLEEIDWLIDHIKIEF